MGSVGNADTCGVKGGCSSACFVSVAGDQGKCETLQQRSDLGAFLAVTDGADFLEMRRRYGKAIMSSFDLPDDQV